MEQSTSKRCPDCKVDKPLHDFARNAAMKDGRGTYCRPCLKARNARYHAANRETQNAKSRQRYAANRDAHRDYHLRRKYGLNLFQLQSMVALQDGKCAICGEGFVATPHVDHDHACCRSKYRTCGKCVRGLLCGRCNAALGGFRDDPALLMRAQEYLTRKSGTEYQ